MKWFGQVGFRITERVKPGVCEDRIVERDYYGDLLKNYKKDKSDSTINDEFTINNQIRILSDPFLSENFHQMRYITFMGNKYKIASVEVNFPGMLIDLGGLYNEEEDDGNE